MIQELTPVFVFLCGIFHLFLGFGFCFILSFAGVVLAETVDEACEAVDSMLLGKQFGSAGESVVVEEFLTGEEASFFVIVDSKGDFKPLHSAQDHKAAYDGDKGKRREEKRREEKRREHSLPMTVEEGN